MNIILKVKKANDIVFSKLFNIKNFNETSYEWLEYKEKQIKQSTYYNYKFIIEKYIVPYFNNKNIRKMRDFNLFIDDLSTRLSPKTIRDIINVFKAILTYYEDTYSKKLKYKKIVLPKQDKKEIEVLTSKEKDRIEKYCMNFKNLKLLGIIISLNTGMRLGELCALRWKNIDLTEKCIYVKETAQRVYKGKGIKSKVIIDTPKTKCSVRTIPINTKLLNILKPLKQGYNDDDFFLTGSKTRCLEPRSYQDIFKKVLAKAKVKEHNFHCTRHTFATNCIEVGMDIKTLSKILGHANVQITLNTYVHTSKKQMKKYLEKL